MTASDMIAAVPGDFLVLDAETAHFRATDGSRREAVNSAEAATLQTCATFAPRNLHAQRLAQASGWTVAQSAASLAALEARGLVRPVGSFLGALDPAPAPPLPEPLVVIRAYQRPDGLKALLDSLLVDERRHDAARRYAIVDDTLDDACAARTYAIAQAFAAESRSSVRILGTRERERALARVLAPVEASARDAARELLDPARPCAVTGSRTWNWAVLLGAGSALSILDDDTRFPLRELPGARRAFDLLDATETLVRYPDDGAELDALPLVPGEPYAALARYVGQPVQALLARDGWDARALAHRSPRELVPIARNARIVAAVPGTYGTITLDSSVYLTYPAESIGELLREPYRPERLAADRVAQGYDAPRITSFALYTPLLIDARALLPFAGTWGRVDDTYFLMLLRAIAPDAAYAHVPAMLGHADYTPRDRIARALERIPLDRNAFVSHLFAGIGETLGGTSREARLAAVGAAFATLADASDAALVERVLRWREEMTARLVRHLDQGLRAHPGAPPAWRTHVERVIEANRRGLRDDRLDATETARIRAALRQVANVAPAWIAMWEAAREAGPEACTVSLC